MLPAFSPSGNSCKEIFSCLYFSISAVWFKSFFEEKMRQNITVSVPDKIKIELEEIASKEGLSKSEIIRNAIQDYLYIKRFRALRNKMMAKAQSQGIFTNDDVFALLDKIDLLQDIQTAESQFQAGLGIEHEKAKAEVLSHIRNKKSNL